jgi:PKD repeat protein
MLALVCAPAVAAAAVIDVPAGGDLQGALNRAQPGDIVELEPGAIYVGNFVLPVKDGATEIVVRTRAVAGQPARGRRLTPAHAGVLAKLQSPNSLPAVQTAASAHHWTLELLELGANEQGFGEILRLGLGGSGQDRMELVPHHLVIDRCYIHGDPAAGQKRGIGLNSAATTIINSHISDIKGVGFDTQAIGGWNGPGPYVIENNYLEAAGENVMFGGSDPMIANLTPSDITFRGNHLSKPREWREAIIPAPAASASAMGGGTLPAGTYAYRVVARRYVGQWMMGGSDPSTEVKATLTASGAVQVQWTAVDGATEYRVYGRTAGGQKEYWTVRGTSWIDAGTPGTAGAVTAAGSRWTVKNLFELKHAQRVLVEGNVFENSWAHAQGGLALVMTPRNPGGVAPWTVVADVTIRYNLIRHTGGGLSINGYDTNHVSQQAHDIRVEQNLFYDINDDEDGIGRFLIIGGGPRQVTFDHNTIVLDGTVMLVHGKNADGTYDYVEDFQFSNNLTLHNRWGLVGEGGGGLGTPSILTYFGTPTTVVSNVLAGGPVSQYPPTNLFPSVDAFWAEFVDAQADDYRLLESSPYRHAGTDGLDLGADVERIQAFARGAISGTGDARAPVAVPGGPYAASTLTDVTFDGGASWDPDGAIVSYTWDWSDGCPSTQGPIATHQFTHAGTFAVRLTVVDESGAVASATAPAEIANRPPYADAGGPYVTAPGGTLDFYAGGSHDSDGQIVEYRWNWGDGSPEQVTSNASVAHAYASAGEFTAVLTVVDDVGAAASDTAAVSVRASAPLPGSGPQAPEIVIHAADLPASAVHGAWIRELDPTAASAGKVSTPDAGWSSTSAPRAAPEHYVDVTFRAKGNTPYRLWLRMTAPRTAGSWMRLVERVSSQRGVPSRWRTSISVSGLVSPGPRTRALRTSGHADRSTMNADGSWFRSSSASYPIKERTDGLT